MTPSLIIKTDGFPESYFDKTRLITPTCIVLHWWEEPIDNFGINQLIDLLSKRRLSVQFGVLANAEIYQLTPHPNSFARHAKCANNSSIGIEIQGMGPKDLDSNQKQFSSVVELVRWLSSIYKIGPNFSVENTHNQESIIFHGIASHKLVDPFCANANGKKDVHDSYLKRVVGSVFNT